MFIIENLSKGTMTVFVERIKKGTHKRHLHPVVIPSMQKYIIDDNLDIINDHMINYYKSLKPLGINFIDNREEEEEEEKYLQATPEEDSVEIESSDDEILEEMIEETIENSDEVVEAEEIENLDLHQDNSEENEIADENKTDADIGEVHAYLDSYSKAKIRDLINNLGLIDIDQSRTKQELISDVIDVAYDQIVKLMQEG